MGGSAIGPGNGPGAGGIAVERMAARAATAKFSKIVLASAGEFPYSTSSHGGVAQLGERLNGIQEVNGSIPSVSTKVLIFFGKSGLFAICGTFEKIEEIETGHTALKMKCFCGMPLIFFEWRVIIDLRVRTN